MSDTITIAVPADLVLTFRDAAVPIGTVDAKGVLYLIQNGWSQSMTDTATSARAKVLNDATAEWAKANGGAAPNATERATIAESNADAIAEAEREALAKRLDAIMQGTIVAGQRGGGGPRKSPMEAYVWERATADAKATVRDRGLKWPKETEAANAIVERVLAKRRKAYEQDFAKRAKQADDLDDII